MIEWHSFTLPDFCIPPIIVIIISHIIINQTLSANGRFCYVITDAMASDQVLPLPDSGDVELSNKTEEARSLVFPLLLDGSRMTVAVCGYVTPAIVLLTVINNATVCVVLLRRTMRSATNTVLVGMAVADTLTGLLPLPHYVHFYTAGRYSDWVPYNWCVMYSAMTDHLPTACHTASIWLTVTLAFHRYSYSVVHPLEHSVLRQTICCLQKQANFKKTIMSTTSCVTALIGLVTFWPLNRFTGY